MLIAADFGAGDEVSALVKGEDLAAEPTLAFLAMSAVDPRCSGRLVAIEERRLAEVGEVVTLVVVVEVLAVDDEVKAAA